MKDDLCKLNLVLNSFSVSPIYVSWLFEVVSVTVALCTTHLVRDLPSSGQEFFFADSYIVFYLELILSLCAVVVSGGCLTLIDKHFPKNKRLSKIFNRNTIKVSYSCLLNLILNRQSPITTTAYIYVHTPENGSLQQSGAESNELT